MRVNQIRYFLAVCQEHSFTRAARRCGVAQPTVTNAIKLLEREFGVFRKPKIELTNLGQVIHPYLCRLVKAADLAHAAAKKRDKRTQAVVMMLEAPAAP
jgi:LysR family transcriptional regulator, hydrogen peroxide-inducible genes activator